MALRSGATAALPAAVQGWSAALAALEPAVVHALAPLLQRVDELVARHVDVEGPDGEPEGYGGLSTRGAPERLLASEWALLDVEPDEFLRRAASRELLHVETAFRHDPPGGVTRVVVDTGPAQAGAARLVQLAALVVLHRRAAGRGACLEVGILGHAPDTWLQGDLPELLSGWLTSRQVTDAGPETVADRRDADPDAWFVVRPGLVDRLPVPARPVRQVLTVSEGTWSDAGVVGVDVVLAGERVRLPVPPAPEALRVLRGQGFRREAVPRRRTTRDGGLVLRDAILTGSGHALVGRGQGRHELVTARIVEDQLKAMPRVRRLPGPVVAAGATGRRLVVLHATAGGATVTVLGKQLRTWDGTFLEGSTLRLTEAELAGAAVLAPVHHHQGELWVGWPSAWHLLSLSTGVTVAPQAVAVVPKDGDQVVVAMRNVQDKVGAAGFGAVAAPPDARVVSGGGWLAVETGGGTWRLVHTRHRQLDVGTRPGSDVVGLVELDAGEPHLVTISAGQIVLRLVTRGAERTLTSLSGAHQRVAVHPVRPWLARDLGEGEIELHDLRRGVRIATYPGNLA
ncbi:hypothetical protein Cch01nite_00060 [Cellulomonas chitinilytica]|uniref:Uncharacterized protein n=1 Tax=Cellulomonas chitinilytica TaxID=398759 RepID=A0A919U078_9CELL|nr:hypothetical protein [Cellulomonas chitinilytica]GIG19282.1 hypothetical protein Cch01nite_00060 [Cellulomonas chitinilytica]